MSKQKKLESPGKESFIDAVLAMLDEGTSLREINLRKAARRIGCAHTNAYNYFASYEELLWWSLRAALEAMTSSVDPETGDIPETYVRFALDHPAWYRLIWLEPLSGDPPAEVAEFLSVPAQLYTRWLTSRFGSSFTGRELEIRGRVLHGYLHGELSAITAGRVTGTNKKMKERVLSGSALLIDSLFGKNETQ